MILFWYTFIFTMNDLLALITSLFFTGAFAALLFEIKYECELEEIERDYKETVIHAKKVEYNLWKMGLLDTEDIK